MRIAFLLLSAWLLAGCTALQSPGVRITVLVLVPAAFTALVLWRLRRGRGDGLRGRGPRYPDFDEKN